MPYAEVSVNSPVAQRKAFSYAIPDGLGLEIGQAVWVPFGDKTLQGVVLELTPYPKVEETREIAGVIEQTPLLSPALVSLAVWISNYYLAPLFETLALMLPPGFERRIESYYSPIAAAQSPAATDPEQGRVFQRILTQGQASLKELETLFGKRPLQRILLQLIKSKLVSKSYRLEKVRIKPRVVPFLQLKVPLDEAQSFLRKAGKRAVRQADLVNYLVQSGGPVRSSEVRSASGATPGAIRTLLSKGLIEVRELKVERDPLAARSINLSFPLSLTPSQEIAFEAIRRSLIEGARRGARGETFLLRGVTGSGKTEIYLQLLMEAVKVGKKAIVLVPEISMTPQIIERFLSRFPGRVAVLHSELPLGQRFDEWWGIKKGQFDVVIGPRSAIFSPQADLGLIIMDEEHEWTYKQQDSPRYYARRVAEKLSELTGATLVLGSATPDVESYFLAENSQIRLLELNERVTSGEATELPAVQVVDLRSELKAGNLSIFSRALSSAIDLTLKNKEQVILFLNRRGSASFVECRNCGFVVCCRRCQVPLTYHSHEDQLVCHQCNYRIRTPAICPRCRSRKIRYLGIGTEKLELETTLAFPQARVLRWDSDVTRGHPRLHQEIFNNFRSGQSDILIGTQMIAKGLDLPRVTLVGVINADIALNLPDFRANERTFQLLSQVAGRAGRGPVPGKVIIQTYSPENYSIQAAAGHDYLTFYRREIEYRRTLHNPPFSRLARLTFIHTNLQQCQIEAERVKQLMLDFSLANGIAGLDFIGPAPAFIERLRGRYRWQIILRGSDPAAFLSSLSFPKGWTIDIDPLGMA
jgi:primosomal protein N' (replication factor Y)